MVEKKQTGQAGKAAFVSGSDRPELRLKSDTPLSSLTVRDLGTILGRLGTRKDFWDGKDWQKDDFDGPKPWKEDKEFKEWKEKEKEFKEWKEKEKEKREIKEVKHEKLEKLEKIESDGVFEVESPIPDPRIEQVVQALAGISAKVDQLANQVAELRKRTG
jgi:hypothetical protein